MLKYVTVPQSTVPSCPPTYLPTYLHPCLPHHHCPCPCTCSRPRSITASGCNNYKIFNRIIKAAGTARKGTKPQAIPTYLPTYLAPGNGPCDNVNQSHAQTTRETALWERERESVRYGPSGAVYRVNFSRTPSKQFATGYQKWSPLFAWCHIPCRQSKKRIQQEGTGEGEGRV